MFSQESEFVTLKYKSKQKANKITVWKYCPKRRYRAKTKDRHVWRNKFPWNDSCPCDIQKKYYTKHKNQNVWLEGSILWCNKIRFFWHFFLYHVGVNVHNRLIRQFSCYVLLLFHIFDNIELHCFFIFFYHLRVHNIFIYCVLWLYSPCYVHIFE